MSCNRDTDMLPGFTTDRSCLFFHSFLAGLVSLSQMRFLLHGNFLKMEKFHSR